MKFLKAFSTLTLSLLVAASSAHAGGTIEGTVTVKTKGLFGKQGAKGDASNVVIFLEELQMPNPNGREKIVQKGKQFQPRVLPIVMGGVVEFPNEDPFNHNVFSPTPEYKFDLDYYGTGKSKNVRFQKTGAVRIYCNIHSNMVSDVLVVPNPFFAKTGADGKFRINNIPPGKYTFVAWQPSGASEKRGIAIVDGKTLQVNFEVEESVFSIKHKNKYGRAYDKEY
ncbi:MAG TPA: carboxypeptidase regulatory-like domain-containing protein [Turneriella sp.]|nr:carboxypeptidase regulatory-like domain-containing protein [Turneriella sp.]HNA80301.1 carboxypeptidase regulatory-like domain-containing protein [Turneriella sp.]HNE21274.1 carboxypeptidase regulatory-like domain-containing protein [Turneriella sp.]HNJ66579.1 carboxypeptidase regulatory-like domain-containing protein [Turneriella sp.]HNL11774.1 carboxypeptidase regulatory-like domain-containing protein [Turneriella sp.]